MDRGDVRANDFGVGEVGGHLLRCVSMAFGMMLVCLFTSIAQIPEPQATSRTRAPGFSSILRTGERKFPMGEKMKVNGECSCNVSTNAHLASIDAAENVKHTFPFAMQSNPP